MLRRTALLVVTVALAAGMQPAWAQLDADNRATMPVADVPTLLLQVAPAADNGWAFTIETDRFTFAAEGGQRPDRGGAIVIVDGGAATPLTTPSFGLPALTPGMHEVIVALVTGDGQLYADDTGRLAAERMLIEVPNGSFPTDAATAAVTLIAGAPEGEVQTLRARNGQGVLLRWASDRAVELHVHGFDIEIELEPELPTTVLFVADMFGRFPTELHATGLAEATVLFIEVAP